MERRSEATVMHELQEAEHYASQVSERLARVQGHIDNLRAELLDVEGASSSRPVGVR